MYDPKGGDKPAYDPQYQKPPVENPPQKNPPEYPGKQPPGNGNTCEPPTGNCKCPDWPIDNCPVETEPFRRLLQRLEDVLEQLAEKKPTDATKKFADDLKDADKEYQGVVALVTKFKEFYDKLDCKIAEANGWRDDMASWIVGKLTQAEKDAIKNSRQTNYEDKEKLICCEWIKCRDFYISMLDCLEQAKKKEEEAKDNYEAIKALEKTLNDRFAELKSLFDKAKGFRDEERFRAVYAVILEFRDVYAEINVIRDWFFARAECATGAKIPTGDPKKEWTPEKFKAELVRRLRLLILAKYQKFRWHHDFLTRISDNEKKKEACEKFRKERRDKFIQEADDIEPPEGAEEPGGYGKPTPPPPPPKPEYPGGQTPPPQQYPGAKAT